MKAFTVSATSRVYAFTQPVSMAFGFPRLRSLVEEKLKKKPDSGDLFLFVNTKLNYVKVFYTAKDGECIWSKRLPKGKFDLEDPAAELTLAELTRIVDHVIIHGASKQRHLKVAAGGSR